MLGRHLVGAHRRAFAGVEAGGSDGVARQEHLDLAILRLGEERARQRQLVLLDARLADVRAAGLEKGVGHGAANEEGVDAADQVLEHADLVGDLGATDDGEVGPLDIAEELAEELHLLLQHQEAGALFLDVLDHPRRRRVRAMRAVPNASLT